MSIDDTKLNEFLGKAGSDLGAAPGSRRRKWTPPPPPAQLFVRNSVALASLQSNHATLTIYDAYADWSVAQWRFIGAGYVDVDLDSPTRDESFASGCVQTER